jgi:hypothetical protein
VRGCAACFAVAGSAAPGPGRVRSATAAAGFASRFVRVAAGVVRNGVAPVRARGEAGQGRRATRRAVRVVWAVRCAACSTPAASDRFRRVRNALHRRPHPSAVQPRAGSAGQRLSRRAGCLGSSGGRTRNRPVPAGGSGSSGPRRRRHLSVLPVRNGGHLRRVGCPSSCSAPTRRRWAPSQPRPSRPRPYRRPGGGPCRRLRSRLAGNRRLPSGSPGRLPGPQGPEPPRPGHHPGNGRRYPRQPRRRLPPRTRGPAMRHPDRSNHSQEGIRP